MADKSDFTVRPDAKGRIALGALAKNVSSFRVHIEADGKLVLEPFAEVPMRERWIYENPEISASIDRGIAEAKAGRVVSRGSFKKYLTE
jgi:predicted transcriptional regulator